MSVQISIVIPVYNVATYLEQCLESVHCQTFQDWECILIDDGSTDGSGKICDRWCHYDSRFSVFHQPNGGVSAARNKGIELAKGRWITFIDSDDWVDDNYLEQMLNAPQAEDADLVVCGLIQHIPSKKDIEFKPLQNKSFMLNQSAENEFNDLCSKYLLFSPCLKLFDARRIRFMENKFPIGLEYGEDLEFCFQYLEHVKTISCVSTASYHYRRQAAETLSNKVRCNQFEIDYHQWLIVKRFYELKGFYSDSSLEMLYNRLWGLVYDSIFLSQRLENIPNNYFDKILSIAEIDKLKNWKHVFDCSRWIKESICRRWAWPFKLYFSLK